MVCRRCPHYVRHGQVAEDKKTFTFSDRCSLKMKHTPSSADHSCHHHPFKMGFDYIECDTYQRVFKGASQRNDVVPVHDLPFVDASASLTEMELL